MIGLVFTCEGIRARQNNDGTICRRWPRGVEELNPLSLALTLSAKLDLNIAARCPTSESICVERRIFESRALPYRKNLSSLPDLVNVRQLNRFRCTSGTSIVRIPLRVCLRVYLHLH